MKTVCITGVTRGLGAALTQEFIQGGYCIWGCGRDVGALATLSETHGDPHVFTALDITDGAAVTAWAQSCMASGNAPDLLINNAGAINPNQPLWEMDAATFASVIDVNVKGMFHVIRAFLPVMISHKQGLIVNMSSHAGQVGYPLIAPYCASKHAVEGLTKALAAELPAGLAVVALDPGGIDTDMLRSHQGAKAEDCESPDVWGKRALDFILGLQGEVNGHSLKVPAAE